MLLCEFFGVSKVSVTTYTFPLPYAQHGHHLTTHCRTSQIRVLLKKLALLQH